MARLVKASLVCLQLRIAQREAALQLPVLHQFAGTGAGAGSIDEQVTWTVNCSGRWLCKASTASCRAWLSAVLTGRTAHQHYWAVCAVNLEMGPRRHLFWAGVGAAVTGLSCASRAQSTRPAGTWDRHVADSILRPMHPTPVHLRPTRLQRESLYYV